MKPRSWLIGLVVGIAVLQVDNAVAAQDTPVVQATNKDDFGAVAAAIRQQMQPGGHWQYVSKQEYATVNDKLTDMQSIFDKTSDVAQMNENDKARLLTDQEDVNSILTKRDDRRLVCQSEMPVGSHLPIKTCRTYGEIESERANANQFMRDRMATPQLQGGGG